ncbi:MAG TPA: c-type cytochrome [Burkholderiales bacterium]|nr:c-type cytochrome [Burkholderiales bacterium]
MKVGVCGGLGLTLVLGVASGCSTQGPQPPQLATQVCTNCHGPRGDGLSPAFPRLAGQQPAYLEAQLIAFRDHSRGDPTAIAYMWGMTSQLDNPTIRQLASYYAAQSPVPGVPGDQTLMAKGKAIYEQGLTDEGVPACTSCHGADAEGKDNIPRLGGQYQPYLVKQLAYFKSELRGNAPVMHAVTYKMSVEQMEAVTVYAASR